MTNRAVNRAVSSNEMLSTLAIARPVNQPIEGSSNGNRNETG
ncbi:MAG: hypothetical protein ABUK11_04175 [Mariprofundaceae bacterium]